MGLTSERTTTRLDGRPGSSLDIAPEPVVPGGFPPSRGRATASVGLALLTHVGFAALALALLQWRDLGTRPEQAIPVEIVPRTPPDLAPKPPEPESRPAPAPSVPPAAAEAQPAEAPPPPAEEPARSEAPKPPPPALVEAPPEAAPAKTQPTVRQQANLEPEKPAAPAAKPTAPSVDVPSVLTAAAGTTSVPPPASGANPQTAKAAPAAPDRNAADELAAALPMDLSGLPSSFRAVLNGGGQLPNDDYKGVVFGHLGRAQGAIAEARDRHLRGTVMVMFSVADDGKVADLRVGHSSGVPALDSLALKMVREAAPFPPPPPASQRSFNPVLSFGEN